MEPNHSVACTPTQVGNRATFGEAQPLDDPRPTASSPKEADKNRRAVVQSDAGSSLLARLCDIHADMAADIKRIADVLAPDPGSIVGTPYVAQKLGMTTTWIADMVRRREIPPGCIVAGTGGGKPWKFHRARIDEWLKAR